jgi:hypothetical protein
LFSNHAVLLELVPVNKWKQEEESTYYFSLKTLKSVFLFLVKDIFDVLESNQNLFSLTVKAETSFFTHNAI